MKKLERLRAEHPALNYYIKKRIITDNLFGVDIMEESTEIAKLRLFLALVASVQIVEQLEPLPNIDFNILAGNALIGLMHVNDKDYEELHGQGNMLRPKYQDVLNEKNRLIEQYRNFKENISTVGLEALRDNIREKKREAMVALNDILLREFTKLGIKFEQTTWDEGTGKEGKVKKRAVNLADIEAIQPFHWGYEFDQILSQNGGFDGIITNPPWEIFKPDAKEFFAEHSELVTKNKMTLAEFEKEQSKLLKRKDVREAWLEYLSRFPHISSYFRTSPQYKNQISIINGKKAGTDINLYKLFVEQIFNLLRPSGRCGMLVPTGIYNDLGTKQLREMLFSQAELGTLFGLSNERFIFEGVHHSFKICLLTFTKGHSTVSFRAAFRMNPREAIKPVKLATFLNDEHELVTISVPMIRLLSPDSLSVLEFKNESDSKIVGKMVRQSLLGARDDFKWSVKFTREVNNTSDMKYISESQLDGYEPLYEGKTINQFNHAYEKPRYFVNVDKFNEENSDVLSNRFPSDYYRLCFRRQARATDKHTFIGAIAPKRTLFFDNLGYVKPFDLTGELINHEEILFLLSCLNSYSLQYILRQQINSNLSFYLLYQLPVPRLTEDSPEFAPIVERAAKLVCTTTEFDDLAREVALRDHTEGVTDEAERAKLRAAIEGIVAHLYDLTEEEFGYILSTFPLIEQSAKDAALEEFRKEASRVKRDEREGEIRHLIKQGESAELEFKSSARWDIKQNKANSAMEQIVVKTVAAFLNSERGGTLLLGVDDDGNVLGLKSDYKMFGKQNSRDAYENFLTTLLLNNLGKDVTPLFSITFYNIEGEDVVRITVKPAPKPYFVREGNAEHLYIRAGNSTRGLTTKEAIDYCKIRFP